MVKMSIFLSPPSLWVILMCVMFQEPTRPASWCGTSSSSAPQGAFGSRDAPMNPTSVSLPNLPQMGIFTYIYTSTAHISCVCYSSGSLTALVCQHSITPLALPCQLIIPDRGTAGQLYLYVIQFEQNLTLLDISGHSWEPSNTSDETQKRPMKLACGICVPGQSVEIGLQKEASLHHKFRIALRS